MQERIIEGFNEAIDRTPPRLRMKVGALLKTLFDEAQKKDVEREREYIVSRESLLKQMAIPAGAKLSGMLAYPTHEGIRYKFVRSLQEAQRLREAAKELCRAKMNELRESGYPNDAFIYGNDDLSGGDVGTTPNDEFAPILGGPWNKQLYMNDYLTMHARAFQLKNHHPLAKRITTLIRDYVIGKGIKVLFADPAAQDWYDKWAEQMNAHRLFSSDCESSCWQGEIMTRKTVIRPVQLDPSTVWEIVTNPRDIDDAYYAHRQFPTQYQLLYGAAKDEKASEYVIDDIPMAEIIHWKLNTAIGEKRGRSDLFPVMTWLKYFKDYYLASITKAQLSASFFIDWQVDGAQEDIDSFADSEANQNKAMPYVTNLYHTKAATASVLDNKGADKAFSDSIGEAIRGIIAIGVGLSPEMLGVGGAASTKATALTKESPALRFLEGRQKEMEMSYIRPLIKWVINNAIAAGQLPSISAMGLKPDYSFEVIFPSPMAEDKSIQIKNIMAIEAAGYISKQRAAAMAAQEMAITDYDYEKEQQMRKAEMAADPLALMAMSMNAPQPTPPEEAPAGGTEDKTDYRNQAKERT